MKALLGFLNADLSLMGQDGLLNIIHTFAPDQGPKKGALPLLNYWEALRRIAGPLGTSPTPEAIEERREFLMALQEHLNSKVDAAMEAIVSQKARGIFETRGIRAITADPVTGHFVEEFLGDDKPEDPLGIEKKFLDDRLINLIRDLNLEPWRFKKCQRCGSPYYQFSYREKKYCSQECAGAVRQADFRNKRKGGEKNLSPKDR